MGRKWLDVVCWVSAAVNALIAVGMATWAGAKICQGEHQWASTPIFCLLNVAAVGLVCWVQGRNSK